MDDATRRMEDRICAFRSWRATQSLSSARLVQYCGVECIGGITVSLDETEDQLRGCLEEGFRAEWYIDEEKLYLCIYESLPEPPERSKVIAEESLVDIEPILRAAGFEPKQKDESA